MSQQLSKAAEAATAPHQYALSTRAGCECVAHALQGLVELDEDSTIVSINGISAYDLISRESMMTGLFRMAGGSAVLPFVHMFYGSPSEHLWEDNQGNVHVVPQGEGGEQGDAMMPLLFCLGQKEALQSVQRQLEDGERLFAFLDDVYVVTRPERVGEVYRILEEALRVFSCIRIHNGKTKIWNRLGTRPEACDLLERIARVENPRATVWKGGGVPTDQQGIKVLGTPLGHDDFVASHLQEVVQDQQGLLRKIPMVKDLQCVVDLAALRRGKGQLPAQIRQTFSHGTVRKNPRRRCSAMSGHHPGHRSGSMHRSGARVGDSSGWAAWV